MDYNQWTQKAIDIIEDKIKVGQIFELKSLFEGHIWKDIPAKDRRKFGSYFSNEVKENRVQCESVGKGKDGHNLYKKL